MSVTQNKIFRLLLMTICLTMALAIVTGAGNFALAGETTGAKNL